jgi:hypothetical protein
MHRFVKIYTIISLTVTFSLYKMYPALEQKKCSKIKIVSETTASRKPLFHKKAEKTKTSLKTKQTLRTKNSPP